MNWNDLQVFLAIVRAGTLAKAGRDLRLDQTTVSRRLRKLEEDLGAPLFLGAGGERGLTPLGQKILAHAQKAEGSVASIRALAQGARECPAGNAVISAASTIARHILMPRLGELRQAYPEISVELNVSQDFADLARMEADIALRMQRPTGGDFAIRHVGNIRYTAYENRRTRERKQWIGFSGRLAGMPDAGLAMKHLQGAVPFVRTNDPGLLIEAVRGGSVAAVIPMMVGENDATLARIDGAPVLSRDVWLVTRMDMKDAAHIRAVTGWLAGCFRGVNRT